MYKLLGSCLSVWYIFVFCFANSDPYYLLTRWEQVTVQAQDRPQPPQPSPVFQTPQQPYRAVPLRYWQSDNRTSAAVLPPLRATQKGNLARPHPVCTSHENNVLPLWLGLNSQENICKTSSKMVNSRGIAGNAEEVNISSCIAVLSIKPTCEGTVICFPYFSEGCFPGGSITSFEGGRVMHVHGKGCAHVLTQGHVRGCASACLCEGSTCACISMPV